MPKILLKSAALTWLISEFLLAGIFHAPYESLVFHRTLQIGRGNIQSVNWHPQAEVLAVGTVTDTWIYTDTLTDIAHIPDEQHPTFSPDGRWLATSDKSHHIVFRDAKTFEQKFRLRGHNHKVSLSAWHPTNLNVLATIDESGMLIVWDVAMQRAIYKNRQIENPVKILWSPSGDKIAAMDELAEMQIWDIVHKAPYLYLAAMLSSHYAAKADFSWGSDTHLSRGWWGDGADEEQWNILEGHIVSDTSGSPLEFFGVFYKKSPDKVYALSVDGRVVVIDNSIGEVILDSPSHLEWSWWSIVAVWSPNSQKFAIFDATNSLETWGIRTSYPLGFSDLHSQIGKIVSWRDDGKIIATSSTINKAYLWDGLTGDKLATLNGESEIFITLAWQPQGQILATIEGSRYSSNGNNKVKIWDTGQLSDKLFPITTLVFPELVKGIAWNPDGTRLAITLGRRVYVWDAISHFFTLNVDMASYNESLASPSWNWDGSILLISYMLSGSTTATWLMDPTNGALLTETNQRRQPRYIQFYQNIVVGKLSPMRNRFAGLDNGSELTIWSIENGRPQPPIHHVENFDWSPDGELLLIDREDKPVQIMDSRSGRVYATLDEMP